MISPFCSCVAAAKEDLGSGRSPPDILTHELVLGEYTWTAEIQHGVFTLYLTPSHWTLFGCLIRFPCDPTNTLWVECSGQMCFMHLVAYKLVVTFGHCNTARPSRAVLWWASKTCPFHHLIFFHAASSLSNVALWLCLAFARSDIAAEKTADADWPHFWEWYSKEIAQSSASAMQTSQALISPIQLTLIYLSWKEWWKMMKWTIRFSDVFLLFQCAVFIWHNQSKVWPKCI